MCAARTIAYCRDYRFDARLQLRYSREALVGMNQRPLRATAPATVRAVRVRVTSTNQNGAFFSPAIPEQRRKMHSNKNCTWKIPRNILNIDYAPVSEVHAGRRRILERISDSLQILSDGEATFKWFAVVRQPGTALTRKGSWVLRSFFRALTSERNSTRK